MVPKTPPTMSTDTDPQVVHLQTTSATGEKIDISPVSDHLERSRTGSDQSGNLVYQEEDKEPEIHLRTWVALGCMCLLLCVQSISLQGPPAVLSFIGRDLDNTAAETWVPNSLSLVQAVLGPVISSASDTFQARKPIVVASCIISFIGSGIAPGSENIYRLIASQTLIGVGFAAVPITYVVPSEILPRRWRSMAQAALSTFSSMTAIAAPLLIGALIKRNAHTGWRIFYWIQFAFWGSIAIGIQFGYRPPKRHTRLDHLSFWQKLTYLDLPGCALLTSGLTLFLVGLNLGGGLYSWTNARTLSTLVIGIAIIIGFGLWEWKGTTNGILNHELFRGGRNRGQTFSLCVALIFLEAILLFAFIIFYPLMTTAIFEPDPFLSVARITPFWVAFLISCPVWGFVSSKFRLLRLPLFIGFLLFTAGMVGFSTVQPGANFNPLAFAALAGFGFGSPLILIVSATQLSTPHRLIATATAVIVSFRSISATIFTAIFAAVLNPHLMTKIPTYVAEAVAAAGLPSSSTPQFIGALVSNNQTALANVPGVTPVIIEEGVLALQHAYADSLRVIYIIAAPFGVLACVLCFFLSDMKKAMNYRVDAPYEDLHAKRHTEEVHVDLEVKHYTGGENAD